MPQIDQIKEDKRNVLRVIPSPRGAGEVQSRNVVTMDGVPDPKPDKRGQGTYGGYKEAVVMPEANPDQSWREEVLTLAATQKARNPILATPREGEALEKWKTALLAMPRPRNPLFEGD